MQRYSARQPIRTPGDGEAGAPGPHRRRGTGVPRLPCHSRVLRHAAVFRVTAHPHAGEGEDSITGLELRDALADGRDDARKLRAEDRPPPPPDAEGEGRGKN